MKSGRKSTFSARIASLKRKFILPLQASDSPPSPGLPEALLHSPVVFENTVLVASVHVAKHIALAQNRGRLPRNHVSDARQGRRAKSPDHRHVAALLVHPGLWRRRTNRTRNTRNTPQEYVDTIAEVFALAHELLANDGRSGSSSATPTPTMANGDATSGKHVGGLQEAMRIGRRKPQSGLKTLWASRDVCVAFDFQDDGWYLRQDII